MRKPKFSTEEKLKWVKKYPNGEKSCADISKECCVVESSLRRWVNNYTTQGIGALHPKTHNSSYRKEFKIVCVDAVISGKGSCREIAAKYGIPSPSILAGWIKKYNANEEYAKYLIKKSEGIGRQVRLTRQRLETKHIAIKEYHETEGWSIRQMCRLMNISRSEYFKWLGREVPASESENIEIAQLRRGASSGTLPRSDTDAGTHRGP